VATVFSHGFVGASLALAGPREIPRGVLALCLGALAVLPDADVIGFSFGVRYGDVMGHRGFTHSLVFSGGAGVACGMALAAVYRAWNLWLVARLAVLGFVATASHCVIDAFTNGGLGVGFLIPFDDSRYFAPWQPIEVSPIGLAGFLSARGILVLRSEFMWLNVPWASVLLGFLILKRLAGR
jgi:inner membrane protein